MKILAVGDIIGNAGVKELKKQLSKIKKEKNIDFIIVNGENSAEGMGITEKNFNDILVQMLLQWEIILGLKKIFSIL